MKQINTNKKQTGFSILAVILVIVAVIVAIGVWALSGQTNTSNYSNNSDDIKAASIINDSSSIKLAFDTLVINGSNSNQIILMPGIPSTSNKPNIADPATGIQIPKLSESSLNENHSTNAGSWFLFGLDDFTNQYKTIMISGLSEKICKQINFQLHGVSSIVILSGGNSPQLWKNPDYDSSSTETLAIALDSVNPYDGIGDINRYNNFSNEILTNIPNQLCIDVGSATSAGIPIYAFYRILKRI